MTSKLFGFSLLLVAFAASVYIRSDKLMSDTYDHWAEYQ